MELETLSPPKANPDLGPDNERGWPLSRPTSLTKNSPRNSKMESKKEWKPPKCVIDDVFFQPIPIFM